MVTLGSSKRIAFGTRIPKLNATTHKTLSLDRETAVSNNIPENVSLEQEAEEEMNGNILSSTSAIDLSTTNKQQQDHQQNQHKEKSMTNSNLSKSSVLRNLFFSQQQQQNQQSESGNKNCN